MSKPKRIILVRHGESLGNIDRDIYSKIPDYAVELSSNGVSQALECGLKLKELIKEETVKFYISPFFRTKRTFDYISKSFNKEQYSFQEELRLREQEFGHLKSKEEQLSIRKERDAYSHLYFRIPSGESGSDVYDRISTFLDTLHRDFEKDNFEQNVVLVTHGLTMRLFLMRWFHWTVEAYEKIKNPGNCSIIIMELQDNGYYKIATELEKHNVYHNWVYEPTV